MAALENTKLTKKSLLRDGCPLISDFTLHFRRLGGFICLIDKRIRTEERYGRVSAGIQVFPYVCYEQG